MIDTKRPDPKISSTDEEKAKAWQLALAVRDYLKEYGSSEPVLLDSGNGYHLLFSIDLPVEDHKLIERFLKRLSETFASFDGADVDASVFDPPRVSKIPFTPVRKGTSTTGRPHRLSAVISLPKEFDVLGRDLIEAVAGPELQGETPERHRAERHQLGDGQYTSRLLVEKWLQERGVAYEVKKHKATGNRTIYLLAECPFNPAHNGTDTCIMQGDDGQMSAKCLHNSCSGLGWQEFKEKIGKPGREHYDPPLEPKKRKREKTPAATTELPSKADSKGAATGLPCTDVGNGQRLATLHGADLRYCYPWRQWLAWNGRYWRLDEIGEVERRAKQTARNVLREAADTENKDRRQILIEWAGTSENATRISAMMKLCQSEPGVHVLPEQLNTNPWLFNCGNGTLDLKTGELHNHRRENLITKLSPVEYHQDAQCPLWLACLDKWTDNNPDMTTYLQRVIGYSLTGDVGEQCLWFLHGEGANGKSTFLSAILAMMGDSGSTTSYGIQAVNELLMQKNNESHPCERADLFGRRFVCTIETDEGKRMAESLMKQMTGGDRMRARQLYEKNFEWRPTHKIFLSTNHKPMITGGDHAVWRRIKLIPFTVKIPDEEKDKDLGTKLLDELPGILAWAVQGCLDWQRHGLCEPEEVRVATDEYRTEQDTLGAFIAECCAGHQDFTTLTSALHDLFMRWSGTTISPQKFGQKLAAKGYQSVKLHGGLRAWKGLKIIDQ